MPLQLLAAPISLSIKLSTLAAHVLTAHTNFYVTGSSQTLFLRLKRGWVPEKLRIIAIAPSLAFSVDVIFNNYSYFIIIGCPLFIYSYCTFLVIVVKKTVNVTSNSDANNPIYEEIEDVVRHTDESGEIGTTNNEAYGINKKQLRI